MGKRGIIYIFFGILIAGAFFRFYLITEIPLGLYPDEAMNGNNALEALAEGNFKIFYPENNGREGFFINLQALSIWFFGNEPWALRVVSALFGTLTILGVYLLSRELFMNQELGIKNYGNANKNHDSLFMIPDSTTIALLSSFFLATSYWHLNFSRIGFRAIMVPFLATFGLYFLLKGLRNGKILDMVWAGIFIGLGFHTYIAFRFMPFVVTVPIIWYLWKWWKERDMDMSGSPTFQESRASKKCAPCAILLFLFITFVTALPIGYYFLQNPGDFLGRGGQVSIFAAESPLYEFAKSNFFTLQMFFWQGDCNWRHNYACQPQLHPLVAFFFVIGFLTAISHAVKGITNYSSRSSSGGAGKLQATSLLTWFFFMSLPATLTREGLPHALRAIGMIPPVMIMAGFGAWRFIQTILGWFETKKEQRPHSEKQLTRIQKEFCLLFVLTLLFVPLSTYRTYFLKWAYNEKTYFSFATDTLHIGQYLDELPQETKKYVLVNQSGVEVRNIPMSAQTVMFATDTFQYEQRQKRAITYTTDVETIIVVPGEPTLITMLNGFDRVAIVRLKEKFPDLIQKAPSDFIVFQNY